MVQPRIDVDPNLLDGLSELSPAQRDEVAALLPRGLWFSAPEAGRAAGERRDPDTEWTLTGDAYDGQVATGRAGVYYAPGRRTVTRPLVLADGFNYGPSDLPGLWAHFNAPYGKGEHFLDQLLEAGVDVVLLGFDERHTHIQANAEVAIALIRRLAADAEREDLIVGGVSMGGMITRYALAKMELDEEEHKTGTYFSWDTPHNGAWIPLILQQMAHFFEAFVPEVPGEPKQAELLRSPAAQQLLWAWVENSKYSGEVTRSPLRAAFLQDLERVGGFPSIPRKLGVANGDGQGTALELEPGEIAFDWKQALGAASATARVQPHLGEKERIGGMHIGLTVRRSTTTAVPALDGAPGGTLASFGLVAKALGIPIDARFNSSCFVPSVSAVAIGGEPVHDGDPAPDVSLLPRTLSALDDFQCNDGNSPHSEVTKKLADWLLPRLTK
ncbi:hypothetical protein [Kitasatospora sp. NPDC057223]|uniref:hypothetical protein n=1 Tax=Kitasatospora sp. NPDC057223 TaxID=3346055 RepID=UPI003625F5A8